MPRSPKRLSCLRTRAMDREDKKARERDLLNGALRLFSTREFDQISIVDICKEIGLAKGTFYLYFQSKEEIFLRLTGDLFESWGQDLTRRLTALPYPSKSEVVSAEFVHSVQKSEVLLRLLSILHAVIEKNVAIEAIGPFKRKLAQLQEIHAREYARLFPQLSMEQIQELGIFLSAAVLGTWTMANPPQSARAALKQEGLSQFVPKFAETLKRQIDTYLKGLLYSELK